jgi:hypothetical protein
MPPHVRLHFQRDIDKTKKATAERASEKLRWEVATVEGNNPVPEAYDEEVELKCAKDNIGKAWSNFFHVSGVPGRQADSPYFVSVVRETQKWGKFSFHTNGPYECMYLISLFSIWL